LAAARSGKGDEEVQWVASVVCWEAERGLVASYCGERDGDGCWFRRETEEIGNHGFVGEAKADGKRPKQMGSNVGLEDGSRWRWRHCWFAQRVGGWREEGMAFVGGWMEKRKAYTGSREKKSKAGRAALFFLVKGRERPGEEDEKELGTAERGMGVLVTSFFLSKEGGQPAGLKEMGLGFCGCPNFFVLKLLSFCKFFSSAMHIAGGSLI
jgi:hypothetical protein